MSNKLFSVNKLTFAYASAEPLFHDFDLSIAQGRISCLIGANGSGKTTLFRLLSGQLKPQAGSVQLRRANIADLHPRDLARLVSVVHQKNSAPADMSVRDLLSMGRFAYGALGFANSSDAAMAVDEALEIVGMQDTAYRNYRELSGGQAQKIWIALALVQGSPTLLLDEPTSYLDVKAQIEVLHLIRKLNEEHDRSIVMILHDINQAIAYSHEIIALKKGVLMAQGPAEDVVSYDLISELYETELTHAHSSSSELPYFLAL